MSFNNELLRTPRDGDFLSFDTDNPIDGKPKRLGAYETDGVRFERLGFRMENGTRYIATTTTLPPGERTTDVLNVSSAAWTTKDKGLNRREPLYLAREHGMESCFFSVAQNLLRLGDIREDAQNQLTMTRHIAEERGYQPNHVIYSGISHGAMNGLVYSSLGKERGISVLYGDHRAPCFPNHVADTDLWGNIMKLRNEIGGLINIATTVPPEALLRYPATLHLGPRGALRHLQDVPTLLSGTAGQIVRDGLPQDAFGYVGLGDGDPLSQAQAWEAELAGHPLMIVDRRPGSSHLEECASERATVGWKRRIGAIATILANEEDWITEPDPHPDTSAPLRLYLMATHDKPELFAHPEHVAA